MSDLTGRAAVVTGAAQGIGRAVAASLATAGAGVVLVDLDEQGVAESAESIRSSGGIAVPMVADVADEAAMVEVGQRVERDVAPLGVWVNNAGVIRPSMLHKMEADDFDLVLRVHARGTFLGMREAARHMRAAGNGGSIINVTSSAGLDGTVGQINYAAAKGAIIAMTKSAARELGRVGVRVNAVSPAAATSMTETIRNDPRFSERYLERIPLGRWAEPAEISPVFAFLASDESSYMTGQVLCVDGGTYMAS